MYKTINKLIVIRVLFLIISDLLFIKLFKDVGAAYSEIFVNIILSIYLLYIVHRNEMMTFNKCDLSFIKKWIQIGAFSGVQIFLDNFIYAIMIVRMVNAVSESGNYWVANNFIWGWLLIPVLSFSEIIKKNNLEKLSFKNTWKYGLYIVGVWLLTMPFWRVFIEKCMAVNASNILKIIYLNIPFYITYIISSFIDSYFISKGKTIYTMLISLIVNIMYYGIVFILFKNNYFTMDMNFIIWMFGGGMIVHLLLSMLFYKYELIRTNIN